MRNGDWERRIKMTVWGGQEKKKSRNRGSGRMEV